MNVFLKNLSLTFSIILASYGLYRSWDKLLVANYSTLAIEKLQFILALLLIVSCSLLLWFCLYLLKQLNHLKDEIPIIVEKKLEAKISIITEKIKGQDAILNYIKDVNTRLLDKHSGSSDSSAMDLLKKYGLT